MVNPVWNNPAAGSKADNNELRYQEAGNENKKPVEIRKANRTAQRRFPRLGLPVVSSNASEKYINDEGKKTSPNHWILNQKSDSASRVDALPNASAENMITTKTRIRMNDRVILSFSLKLEANSNREKALMAIPAARI
jgi:hypothetical protein